MKHEMKYIHKKSKNKEVLIFVFYNNMYCKLYIRNKKAVIIFKFKISITLENSFCSFDKSWGGGGGGGEGVGRWDTF